MSLTVLLVLIPLFAVPSNTSIETLIGLGTALAAMLFVIAVYLLVRQGFYRPWLGMLTSILDVSLAKGALAMFLVVTQPHTVNAGWCSRSTSSRPNRRGGTRSWVRPGRAACGRPAALLDR